MSHEASSGPALIARHTGQVFTLSKAPVTIGRDPGSSIVLADPQVSRHHATIFWQIDGYVVQDMGSANGTFVNERRVSGTHVLRHGYVLRIGNTVFDVHLTAAADATAQMPVPPPTYPDDAPTNGSRRLIPIVLGVLAAAVALLCLLLAALLIIPYLQRDEPQVTILSPQQGAQVAMGQEISLQATAADANDIVRLEILVNDFLVGVANSADPDGTNLLTVSQPWTFGQTGPHTISAIAYTERGNASPPAAVLIEVVDALSLLTPTATPTPSPTPSPTPQPSDTIAPTVAPTLPPPSAIPTWTPSPTPTSTPTPTFTPTATSTPTPTATEITPQYDLYVRRMDFSPNLVVGEIIELSVMIATDIYPAEGPFFPASHFRWRQGPSFPWQEEVCPADASYAACTKTVYLTYTDPGDYYVEVEADSRDEVLETDETNNTRGWTITVNPRSLTIRFDTFPDGTPIGSEMVLTGDEFLDWGIRLQGADASSSSCGGIATVPSIRRNTFGVTGNFLTTSDPSDVIRCNFGPVGIRFSNPARRVTLTFTGASDVYTLSAYNGADVLLGTATQTAVAYGPPVEVTFTSGASNISRVTLGGPGGAVTAITAIEYEW
ncbi:MAG: FHA domain-containing protein [Anaerolineae bacterium]|jgi:hypothetical protein